LLFFLSFFAGLVCPFYLFIYARPGCCANLALR